MAIILMPVVMPDIFSAKVAFEYRLSKTLNLVIPLEAKWMNYRWALQIFNKNFPEVVYKRENQIKPIWNFDYSQILIQTGIGLKGFPLGESMSSAFFMKSGLLFGIERFNAFSGEGVNYSAIITLVWSAGYSWVMGKIFSLGLEAGMDYSFHLNPIKNYPSLFDGFAPFLQITTGFIF